MQLRNFSGHLMIELMLYTSFMTMNAQYADSAGTIEYIVDQVVPLQS
jgi:hypothetical protein